MKRIGWMSALVLAFAPLALADENKPLGISIRAGQFYPSAGLARNEGKTWFSGGIEFKLSNLKAPAMGETPAFWTISADWYGKGDLSNVPVLLNLVSPSGDAYFSFGAGVGFNQDFDVVNNVRENKRDTQWAFQLSAGYNLRRFKMPVFVEARYFGNLNDRLNGFGFFAGVRL